MTMAVPGGGPAAALGAGGGGTNLADILERVLDKGVVIAGDIRINLLDIELLTIKIRLLVASVDKAREMGIDWWEHDPSLSSAPPPGTGAGAGRAGRELAEENERLRERLAALESPPEPESEPERETARKPDAEEKREEAS